MVFMAVLLVFVLLPIGTAIGNSDRPLAKALAIWAAVGVYLMLRFLRRPQGEQR